MLVIAGLLHLCLDNLQFFFGVRVLCLCFFPLSLLLVFGLGLVWVAWQQQAIRRYWWRGFFGGVKCVFGVIPKHLFATKSAAGAIVLAVVVVRFPLLIAPLPACNQVLHKPARTLRACSTAWG